jgi:hypothetical protein
MRARCSGGQPQDFQRNLGYLTTGDVVNEEIQGKGVTAEAVSHKPSAKPAAMKRQISMTRSAKPIEALPQMPYLGG